MFSPYPTPHSLPLRESAHNSRAHSTSPARRGTCVQDERSASRDSKGVAAVTPPLVGTGAKPRRVGEVSEEGNSTRNYPPLTNTRACTYSPSVYGHKVSSNLPILRGNIYRQISPLKLPKPFGVSPQNPTKGTSLSLTSFASAHYCSLRSSIPWIPVLAMLAVVIRLLQSCSAQAKACTYLPARERTQ